MKPSSIDHLVITSPKLEAGAEFVRKVLGVTPRQGGEHPRMATHNVLLRLGDSLFLEVISPKPDLPPPQRARWFALDRLAANSPPRLSTWVARTTDIHATAARSSEALGSIETMTRGTLDWLITIPADGDPPLAGMAPALIEWQAEPHPAARLPDDGLALVKLELLHPEPDRISALLASIAFQGPVHVSPLPAGMAPCLVAHIETPRGLCKLSAP